MELPRDAIFATMIVALALRCIAEVVTGRERIALRRLVERPTPSTEPSDAVSAVSDGRWM